MAATGDRRKCKLTATAQPSRPETDLPCLVSQAVLDGLCTNLLGNAEQPAEFEGLDEEFVGAEFGGQVFIVFGLDPGEDIYGDKPELGSSTEPAEQIKAAAGREFQIQEDELR